MKVMGFRVLGFSFYDEDVLRLDEVVRGLKARGVESVNRSSVLRYALKTLDVDSIQRDTLWEDKQDAKARDYDAAAGAGPDN